MQKNIWVILSIISFLFIIGIFCLSYLIYESTIRSSDQIDYLVSILSDLEIEEVVHE